MDLDESCNNPEAIDASGLADGPVTSQNIPNEDTSKYDELGIAGVSTHDLCELENNVCVPVIKEILGEDATSSGFDLFNAPDSSENSRFTLSPSTSADKSGLCSRASDEEYIPVEGDTISETSFSEDDDEGTEESKDAPRKKRRKLEKAKKMIKLFVDDSNDIDFEERLRYQKKGVVWLCGLHEQYVGGILADEMGLGKTIQVIAFLRALDESQKQDNYMNFKGLGPCLIICPSTLLKQWVSEIHQWMPRCRVLLFTAIFVYIYSISNLIRGGSILVTTYSTFQKYSELLLPTPWHYAILDEGHKIRNPKAQVLLIIVPFLVKRKFKISQTVKQLHTPCRLILSGTPLQNSLSLMDFVYSGKLNSLDTFTERFAIPITQGGYANATKQQLLTAYKCAVVLRDAISPYILRRLKKDVKKSLDLPEKNEKVLFCELSSEQRQLYKDYLSSRECRNILKGRLDAFVGLTLLRKLCNHPDLVTGGPNRYGEFDVAEDPSKAFGYPDRSGKMRVLLQLLTIWRKQPKPRNAEHSREEIVRRWVSSQFNEDPDIFIFLLTTRVGGLGINLTAANKVVRQIFKHFLANRILKDPKQRQFFKTNDLHDLFSLSDVSKEAPTETGTLFASETDEIRKNNFFDENDRRYFAWLVIADSMFCFRKHRKRKKGSKETEEDDDAEIVPSLSEEKKAELRERARRLAKLLSCLLFALKKHFRSLSLTASVEEEEVTSAKVATPEDQPNEKKLDVRLSNHSPASEESISRDSHHRHVKSKKEKKHKRNHEVSLENKGSDDFVLSCLLKSAGVRCAIKHDDLVEDKPSDYLIEKEAAAAANNAAKALGKRNASFVPGLIGPLFENFGRCSRHLQLHCRPRPPPQSTPHLQEKESPTAFLQQFMQGNVEQMKAKHRLA
ncbi:unnamed protein product [Strongylus vulgaris]|uniref:Helicase ATP-binding domain-containing protein n=1 Tax=Strongylus vulgaris TaxID=40348 RepID=A0A3P7JJL5_STRVU|nr:unnamed protein product [Strongylus vulgaris]